MKSKFIKRILLVAVPLIWGKYFWDLFANKQLSEELEQLNTSTELNFSPLLFNKDTFQLQLPGWDPFMNEEGKEIGAFGSAQTPVVSVDKKPEKVKPEPVVTKWPEIQYFGFVKNRDKDKTLCLLRIDGRNHKVSKGDTFNKLVIVGVYHDSVRVSFGGEFRTVRKG